MKTIEVLNLKIAPYFLELIKRGLKTFEYRKSSTDEFIRPNFINFQTTKENYSVLIKEISFKFKEEVFKKELDETERIFLELYLKNETHVLVYEIERIENETN